MQDTILYTGSQNLIIKDYGFTSQYYFQGMAHLLKVLSILLTNQRTVEKYSKPMESDILMNELKASLIIFFSMLDEKQRRLYAGLESLKVGHGGDKYISEVFDINEKTVSRGRKELLEQKVEVDTIGKKGGGRKEIKNKFQTS